MSFDSMSAAALGLRLLQPNDAFNGSYVGGNDAANGGTGSSNTNQNNDDGGGDGGGGGGEGNDAYEFIAFLLWYVFLVLCCVIPTCCAYRRRRQVEARMVQQQSNMDRWQATNMFIVAGGFRNDNAEHVQAHRTKYLEQELKPTTMVRKILF
jgi:hypothetical protein